MTGDEIRKWKQRQREREELGRLRLLDSNCFDSSGSGLHLFRNKETAVRMADAGRTEVRSGG